MSAVVVSKLGDCKIVPNRVISESDSGAILALEAAIRRLKKHANNPATPIQAAGAFKTSVSTTQELLNSIVAHGVESIINEGR